MEYIRLFWILTSNLTLFLRNTDIARTHLSEPGVRNTQITDRKHLPHSSGLPGVARCPSGDGGQFRRSVAAWPGYGRGGNLANTPGLCQPGRIAWGAGEAGGVWKQSDRFRQR